MSTVRNLSEYKEIRNCIKNLIVHPTQFMESLKSVQKLGSGTYNDVFTFVCNSYPVVLKVSYYDPHVLTYIINNIQDRIRLHKKKITLDDEAKELAVSLNKIDPVKIKNNYSIVCRLLIDYNVCDHFVYIYHHTDFKGFHSRVRHLLPEKRLLNEHNRFTNISFHEKFNGNLHQFLAAERLTEKQVTSVIFQVIYALCCLQHYLPGFRHNDLSTSNILINKYASKGNCLLQYNVYDFSLQIQDCGVFAAIWDFDLSHAPGWLCSSKRVNSKNDIQKHAMNLRNFVILQSRFANYQKDLSVRYINDSFNLSFDVYFFLHNVHKIIKNKKSYVNLKDFIGKTLGIVNDDSQLETYQHYPEERLFPHNLIKDPFFSNTLGFFPIVENDMYTLIKQSLKEVPVSFICDRVSSDSDAGEHHYKETRLVSKNTKPFQPENGIIYSFAIKNKEEINNHIHQSALS